MIFGLLVAVAGIGAACALIYRAAVYAVPLAVGMWIGFGALHSGSGPVIALGLGFVSGAVVFGIGQSAWNSSMPKAARYAVALLFVLPAMWTSYCAVDQLANFVVKSGNWSLALALAGAMAVGSATFVRLASASRPPIPKQ